MTQPQVSLSIQSLINVLLFLIIQIIYLNFIIAEIQELPLSKFLDQKFRNSKDSKVSNFLTFDRLNFQIQKLQGIPTCKMVFEISSGGGGKACEVILNKSILIENNFSSLESEIFTNRNEFYRLFTFVFE